MTELTLCSYHVLREGDAEVGVKAVARGQVLLTLAEVPLRKCQIYQMCQQCGIADPRQGHGGKDWGWDLPCQLPWFDILRV